MTCAIRAGKIANARTRPQTPYSVKGRARHIACSGKAPPCRGVLPAGNLVQTQAVNAPRATTSADRANVV